MTDMSDGKRGPGESGGETPSLADHSGNNTPAGTRKTKVECHDDINFSQMFCKGKGGEEARQTGAPEVG